MITAAELRRKAENQYRPVLKALILGEDPFPLPIRYGRLKLTAPIGELRSAIETIQSQSREILGCGYAVEWRKVATQRYGENEVPGDLSVVSAEDLFRYLGREKEAAHRLANARRLSEEWPAARAWASGHFRYLDAPGSVIEYAIRIVRYLAENPFPGVFARELPVEMPTKFIEEHAGMLDSLMRAVAPGALRAEGETLEERLGLKTAESFIEVRLLDLEAAGDIPFSHFTASPEELTIDRFSKFESVVIVENRTTFLTLPPVPAALAILGQGYALHRLARLPWLARKRLFYWGDLDVEGFEILAGLRSLFGHVDSVLMDRETLARNRSFMVAGSGKGGIAPERRVNLTPAELSIADELGASNRRLEQEKIPQGEVTSVFAGFGRFSRSRIS